MSEHAPHPPTVTGPAFRERLSPGPAAWCGAVGLGVIVGVTLYPLAHAVAIVVGVLVAAATLAALLATSPVIEVADGRLRAGKAQISLDLLGEVTTMDDAEAMRTALGPALDARAFVCLRAWARTGVQVDLEDPLDPTPYWLLSTRRPQELAAALAR
ncbi:DUF3093 domain-containing protein [Isoptericola sp. NPDC057391]|uniref:DUF3093 domain-containing protein n=1 Tax=Isoptericola sp. NPDC057391 TaxID=3346117 RepID=UPI003635E310